MLLSLIVSCWLTLSLPLSLFYGTAFTEWLPVVYCYSFMRNSTGNSRLLIKNSSILILSCLCGCATAQPLRRIGTVRSRVCSVAEWDEPVEVVGSFFSINLSWVIYMVWFISSRSQSYVCRPHEEDKANWWRWCKWCWCKWAICLKKQNLRA